MPFNSLFKRRPLTIFSIVCISIIALVFVIRLIGNYYKVNHLGEYHSDSQLGVYKRYAVSTDSAQCAHIGREILDINGTAGDAAIAILLCMGVTIPHSMGLGGGSLILYYNSTTKQVHTIDARESAPYLSHKDLFRNITDNYRLPLSIGVPGELAGYWELHQRAGRLKWKQLFEGAIKLAKNGFYVSSHLAFAFTRNEKYIKSFSPLRDFYLNKTTNECYKQGNKISNPTLGRTLQLLSDSSNPLNVFYNGIISNYIIEDIKEFTEEYNFKYIIRAEDFMNYKVRTNLEAVRTGLQKGNLTLFSFPLPGSGNVLAFILKVMEKYDDLYPNAAKYLDKSILFYHRLIETFKFAFSLRTLLEDNSYYNFAINLTSDEFIKQIKDQIDDKKTFSIESGKYGNNIHITEDNGTAHVSVIDRQGNAVAVTTTINSYFGSKVLSKRTGIVLNDELFDFKEHYEKYKYPANERNLLKPGKRPISSMCPTIVIDGSGKVRLAIGAAGNTKITTGVALVMIRHLWFGEDIKKAIDAPRLHHNFNPNEVIFEKNFPKPVLNGLTELGHKITPLKGRGSVVMAITANNKNLFANSDYRKGGDVDGI